MILGAFSQLFGHWLLFHSVVRAPDQFKQLTADLWLVQA